MEEIVISWRNCKIVEQMFCKIVEQMFYKVAGLGHRIFVCVIKVMAMFGLCSAPFIVGILCDCTKIRKAITSIEDVPT